MGSRITLALVTFILCACNNGVNFGVPPRTDNFAQNVVYNNKVDILFIVDNTPSMEKVRQNILDGMPQLIQSLNDLKMDYRIASTSTTMATWYPKAGKLHGTPVFLTPQTPDFNNLLADKIIMNNDGSSTERGLDAMEKVLSANYLAGEGNGFLRADALLAVIYLTNEDDKSINIKDGNPAGEKSAYYRDILNGLKPAYPGGQKSWLFNFVGITSLNDTCSTGTISGYKEPGMRLMELAQLSQGRIESICDANLGSAVSNIRKRIVQILTDFKLSKKPILSSIQVHVNGVLIPEDPVSGWSYIADINVIRFNGNSVPPADAEIHIDFDPDGSN